MVKKPTGRLTCISTAQCSILNRDALGCLKAAGRQLNVWFDPSHRSRTGLALFALVGPPVEGGARYMKEHSHLHLNSPLIYGMNKKCCRSQKDLEDLEDRLPPRLRPGPFSPVGLIKICMISLLLCFCVCLLRVGALSGVMGHVFSI